MKINMARITSGRWEPYITPKRNKLTFLRGYKVMQGIACPYCLHLTRKSKHIDSSRLITCRGMYEGDVFVLGDRIQQYNTLECSQKHYSASPEPIEYWTTT